MKVKERNTLENGRLKPKEGGLGILSVKEVLLQRGVWGKDGGN